MHLLIVETRRTRQHIEIDTVIGKGSKDCIVTLVERKSGYVMIGKLKDRTTRSLNQRCIKLLRRERARFKTIATDNGTEFNQYPEIEAATNTRFYFATPHHSWERGTNENTNGLIRQYLPKGSSMKGLTQAQCDRIAKKLNTRPRKRHGFKTPEEILYGQELLLLHFKLDTRWPIREQSSSKLVSLFVAAGCEAARRR